MKIGTCFIGIILSVLSILLCGTRMALVLGKTGLVFAVCTLLMRSKKYKPAAITGIALSFIGILLSFILLFVPGTPLDRVMEFAQPHRAAVLSAAESVIPTKYYDVLMKVNAEMGKREITENNDGNIIQNPLIQTENAREMKIHFLDVGQGLSILVESDGHFLLYDGGDRNASSFVVSYLMDAGVKKLDYVIASHYDADHLNGVVGALNVFPTELVLAPDYTHDSTRVYQSFQNIIKEKNIPLEYPVLNSSYTLGNSQFTILGPSKENHDDANDNSIIIMLQNGSDRILITGDGEYASEDSLCGSGADLNCDIYVAGHHGSGSSTSWKLLQKSTPEYCIISCGKDNPYGHPHDTTMEKLESMDIEVYRTDIQGTIICLSSGDGFKWSEEPCNDYSPGIQK